MLDIEGIVLHKIILRKDLDSFSKLRSHFFNGKYSELFRHIYKFYMKYGEVPSFEELELAVTKQPLIQKNLYALKQLEIPDVPIDLAVDALVDAYVQDSTLNKLEKYLNNITKYDASEIQENLANILLELDSELNTDESILYADQLSIFRKEEDTSAMCIPTGISNWFDANMGGYYQEDLVLIGGYRGSGKSVVCANLIASQFQQGNVGVYFTIEMTGQETFDRIMSILSKVPFSHIKRNLLTKEDELKLVETRLAMFEESEGLKEEYLEHRDRFKFERELLATKHLKKDNQIIIVDDRDLSIASIDFTLQKLKAKHGDKLKLVAVDYVNQIRMGTSDDIYDWKEQISISKQLKNMARKYNCVVVSPYQIDDSGTARFARGILDACDMALILKAEAQHMTFICDKSRGSTDRFRYRVGIDWESLCINPTEVSIEEEEEEQESSRKKKRKEKVLSTQKDDL